MTSCSAIQRRSVGASPASFPLGLGDVGGDEQESRLALGAEQRELVLAQHLARGVADERPELGAGDAADRRRGDAPATARAIRAAELGLDHVSVPHRSEVDLRPFAPRHPLGLGDPARRLEAGVAEDGACESAAAARSSSSAARSGRVLAGGQRGHARGEREVHEAAHRRSAGPPAWASSTASRFSARRTAATR